VRRMLAVAVVVGVLGGLPTTVASATPKAGPEKIWLTPSSGGTTTKHPGRAMLTGSFSDYGKSVSGNSKGKPTRNGAYALLILKKGTILLDTSQLDSAFKNTEPQTVNVTSCSLSTHLSAPVTIVNGTKAYAGIQGTFSLTATAAFIRPTKKGSCTATAAPVEAWATFAGSGIVGFGS
jgi:hypothetical protein